MLLPCYLYIPIWIEKKTTRRFPCMHVSIRFDVFKWEITLKSVKERLLAGARTTVPQWRIINDCIMFVGIVVNGRQHHARKLSRFCFFLLDESCNKYGFNRNQIEYIISLWKFMENSDSKFMNLWHHRFRTSSIFLSLPRWLNTVDLQKKFCARMI